MLCQQFADTRCPSLTQHEIPIFLSELPPSLHCTGPNVTLPHSDVFWKWDPWVGENRYFVSSSQEAICMFHIGHISSHHWLFFALNTSWSRRWLCLVQEILGALPDWGTATEMTWVESASRERVCVCVHSGMQVWVFGGLTCLYYWLHITVKFRLLQATYKHVSFW